MHDDYTPRQDHLHIRGEYKRVTSIRSIYLGSPPHTWRILNDDAIGALGLRITSTYVENTLLVFHMKHYCQDHLHIRGEYQHLALNVLLRQGSPPHTWRIHIQNSSFRDMFRITSTYVENTPKLESRYFYYQDHLHIRGEYYPNITMIIFDEGSPPHTWRILMKCSFKCGYWRITSTYVENTPSCNTFNARQQDHLHIRGEYLLTNCQMMISIGSPPHTWRILVNVWVFGCPFRITSTYVENTFKML